MIDSPGLEVHADPHAGSKREPQSQGALGRVKRERGQRMDVCLRTRFGKGEREVVGLS